MTLRDIARYGLCQLVASLVVFAASATLGGPGMSFAALNIFAVGYMLLCAIREPRA